MSAVPEPVPQLGCLLAGWPAFVVDVVLRRHLQPYLAAMTAEQRREMEHARRSIHAAALLASADGIAETEVPVEQAPSGQEVTTGQAAAILGVTPRRVRQLAAAGLGRKVGGVWLIDVEEMADMHRGTAA